MLQTDAQNGVTALIDKMAAIPSKLGKILAVPRAVREIVTSACWARSRSESEVYSDDEKEIAFEAMHTYCIQWLRFLNFKAHNDEVASRIIPVSMAVAHTAVLCSRQRDIISLSGIGSCHQSTSDGQSFKLKF